MPAGEGNRLPPIKSKLPATGGKLPAIGNNDTANGDSTDALAPPTPSTTGPGTSASSGAVKVGNWTAGGAHNDAGGAEEEEGGGGGGEGKKKKKNSKKALPPVNKILIGVLFSMVGLYITLYIVAGFAVGATGVPFDGMLPFKLSWTDRVERKAVLLTVGLGWILYGVFYGLFFSRTGRLWDYIASVCIVHIVLSCIITLSGPSRWEWWVALIPAVGTGIAAAYLVQFLVNRCCRKLEIHPTNV